MYKLRISALLYTCSIYDFLSEGGYARNVAELLDRMVAADGGSLAEVSTAAASANASAANDTGPVKGEKKTQHRPGHSLVFNQTTETMASRLKDLGVDNMVEMISF